MHRLSVAPMMDWTDRHCRHFHRLLTQRTLLYTEMVTTGALLHGDVPRHLRYNAEEHPLALQLGGSEPADLAHCAKLGEQWGYDEINLDCGCPSGRVQRHDHPARAGLEAIMDQKLFHQRIKSERASAYWFAASLWGVTGLILGAPKQTRRPLSQTARR